MAANASDDRHERTDARVTSLVFSNAGVGERDVLQLSRTGGLMFACSSCSPRAAPHLNSGRAVITMWSLSTSWRLHTIGRTLAPCTLLDFGLCLRRPARRPGGAGGAHGLACTADTRLAVVAQSDPDTPCALYMRSGLACIPHRGTCFGLCVPTTTAVCGEHQRIRGHRRCQRGRALAQPTPVRPDTGRWL